MSKNRFDIAEFNSMSKESIEKLFMAIKEGSDRIESARIEVVNAKDDYNKHHEASTDIQRIDSDMFNIDLRTNHLGDPDFEKRFREIYSEYQKRFYNPNKEKGEMLYNIHQQKEKDYKEIILKVYVEIQALAKSLGFPGYRRINDKMDCYEFNQLFRFALQHLFVMKNHNTGLKYDMKESCLYIGPDNKYYPLHQERDIMAVYNEFVKERE